MDDLRYDQLKRETDLELQTSASLSAFVGFGRSTQLVEKQAKVSEYGQKRLAVLSSLIDIENRLAKEFSDSLAKDLASIQAQYSKLSQEAQKRRADLSMNLSDVGTYADQELRNKISNSFKRKPRIFKAKKPIFKAAKTSLGESFKKLSSLASIKSFGSLKPISSITSFSKLKSFGAKTSLSGI